MSRLEREDSGRHEFKYAIPVSMRPRILELTGPHVCEDPNADRFPDGTSGYLVHSLYFDTPDLRDYFERLAGRDVRNRLRVRTYGLPHQDRAVFLENKRKLDDRVVKHRVKICSASEWVAAPGPAPWRPFVEHLVGRRSYAARTFCDLVEREGRVPVSVVHYRREVYVPLRADHSRIRMTLDLSVSATINPSMRDLFAPPTVDLIPPDWMVMELKFDGDLPEWMRGVIRDLKLRASPVSKFGLSVARGWRSDKPMENRFFSPRGLKDFHTNARLRQEAK